MVIGEGTQDAKFCTVNVLGDKARLGQLYFCEHLMPELVWWPEWQSHGNGVTAIHSVVIEADAPETVADMFRAMFGERHVRADGARTVVEAGRPFIEILPGAAGARMTTLRFFGTAEARTVPAEQAGVRLEFVTG